MSIFEHQAGTQWKEGDTSHDQKFLRGGLIKYPSQIVVVPAPNLYRHWGQNWRQALVKKRKEMLELLEAQRVIEAVEAEAREHILTETIAQIHSKFYRVDDFPHGPESEFWHLSKLSDLAQ